MNIPDEYITAAQQLPRSAREKFYAALIDFLAFGKEPYLTGSALAVFTAIEPALRKSAARKKAGKVGGKTQANEQAKSKQKGKQTAKQNESKRASKIEANSQANVQANGQANGQAKLKQTGKQTGKQNDKTAGQIGNERDNLEKNRVENSSENGQNCENAYIYNNNINNINNNNYINNNNDNATSNECDSSSKSPPKKITRFIIPTVNQIADYAAEYGYPKFNAAAFFNYYQSIGWKVGKAPMKDWHAAVRGWISRNPGCVKAVKTDEYTEYVR